jgi:hypothetical protein
MRSSKEWIVLFCAHKNEVIFSNVGNFQSVQRRQQALPAQKAATPG